MHAQASSIAVIVINYNSELLLVRCMAALSAQTLQPTQVIVVDNGGQTPLSIEFATQHPHVNLIRSQKNLGFAAANNLAVSQADNCDWIVLLNPDAFPEVDWLEMLLQAANENPDYAFFGSHMYSAEDPNVLDGTGDIYHTSGRAWRRGHGYPAAGQTNKLEEIFAPCAAAAMYQREAFVRVAGFDENFFCYFEDVDLGFRLRLVGYRCLYVPNAVVYHIGSAVSGKRSEFSVYHGHRNLVWTYIKNMPGMLFWCYLPLHIALNLCTILLFIPRRQAKVILRAKWDALRALPRVWRQRKVIQASRCVDAIALRKLMKKGLIPRRDS